MYDVLPCQADVHSQQLQIPRTRNERIKAAETEYRTKLADRTESQSRPREAGAERE
jgi:hypothetical protein